MEKTSSQDQSASSDSAHDESYRKNRQEMKAAGLFLCNPELSMNASQAEISQPMMQLPYAYSDPYYSALYTAYGPHNMIQQQVVAAAAGRVPLPGEIPEEGPIYVNAKQYHGILRRRQTRAKLEAQNKLVKNRKPYLHESRHQHALNRVRGSGGRFLSTKKSQSSDSQTNSQTNAPDSFHFNYGDHHQGDKYDGPSTAGEGSRVTDPTVADGMMQVPDGRFSGLQTHMAVPMQSNGGFVYNGNRHYASIVR